MSTTTDGGRLTNFLRPMAEAARWAPSVHNSQPWRFRALVHGPHEAGLAVHQDLTRALPVLDPAGRLRLMSCGAAVLNATVALAAMDRRPDVALLSDPADATLVATVEVGPGRPASAKDLADAWAVPRRRTHRRVHSRQPVSPDVLVDLQRAVHSEGARLTVADAGARSAAAALLTRAVREQAANPALVQEIESWVRHWGPGDEPVDGIPVASLGTAPYPVDSLVQEQTDPTGVREPEVEEFLAHATLVAISTPGDSPRDWVTAGMGLERMLLRATSADLVATWADQATQQQGTRSALADALDVPGHVQAVLRLGHPLVDVPATPRRAVDDLLA